MRSLLLRSLAAALVTVAAAPAQAQTVLNASSWVPASIPLSIAQKEWCDVLEKNTSGKMRCNILPRAVAAPPGTFDAVKAGLADVSFTVHGYTPGRFVYPQIAEFPFLGDSAEAISVAYTRVAAKYPQLDAEQRDVHVLAYFTHSPGHFMNTRRAIGKMEDLQGLKWRVGGGVVNDVAGVLNLNATLKPAPEQYELLSGGVMDGTLFSADGIEGFRLEKLIRHVTVIPGGLYNTSFVFMMNKARYEKLTPEEKKAVDAISGVYAARLFGRAWDKADRRGYALMQANGVQVAKADARFVGDIKTRIAPLEAKWVQQAKAKGMADPAKLLADFRAEIARAAKE